MIKDILAKYEKFYTGGSGYTFQVEVDDFNEIVKHIKWIEHLKTGLEYQLKTCKEDVCEMEKEIEQQKMVNLKNKSKRTNLIQSLANKACDRNDETLKKLLDNPAPPNELVKETVKLICLKRRM